MAVMAFSVGLKAQQSFEMPVWDAQNTDSDARQARLYVHLAKNPTGQAIVICPGGGYAMLAMDNEGQKFAPWLNANGISLIVLRYRLPRGRYNVPLSDAEQAMRIVRSHAKEWNIDPNNVGIMGSSAGGHLASTLATHYSSKETRPDFQVLLYPVITMDKSFTHMGSHDLLLGKDADAALEERFSNEKQVTKDTPRAFIVLSATDKIVPVKNTLVYIEALTGHGVQVSAHMYPYGYHGFGYDGGGTFKDAQIWHTELLRWLKRNGQ